MATHYSLYGNTVFGASSFDQQKMASGHTNRVTGLIWMYGSCIVSCSYDGTIKSWNIRKADMPCTRRVRAKGQAKVESLMRISCDLFSSYQAASIDIWNLRQMSVIRSISIAMLDYNPLFEVVMLFNYQHILINTYKKDSVFELNISNGEAKAHQIEGFPSRLYSFIALDKDHFATSEDIVSIFKFKPNEDSINNDNKQNRGELVRTIVYTKRGYDELSIVKHGKDTIVAGSMHGFISIVNWRDGSILSFVYRNGPQVKSLIRLCKGKSTDYHLHSDDADTSQKETIIASINRDKSVQIWNVNEKAQIQTLYFDRDPHLSIAGPNTKILSADKIRKEIEIRKVVFSGESGY